MIYRIFFIFSLTLVILYQSFAQPSNDCRLSGKITDLVGNPLPLSKIQVEDTTKAKFEAEIDQEGNYSVKGFSCGRITAGFTHWGFYREVLEMNLEKGENKTINLGLAAERVVDQPLIKLKGKIFDDQKNALAGAKIKITNVLNERLGSSAVSDAKGSFELIISNEGKYIFFATAENKRNYTFEISIPFLKSQDVMLKEIVLNPLAK